MARPKDPHGPRPWRRGERARGAAAAEQPGIRPLSPRLATAVVGGLNELILEALEEGEEERLAELAGAATELLRAVLRRA